MNYKHKAIMAERSECERCPLEKGKPEKRKAKGKKNETVYCAAS